MSDALKQLNESIDKVGKTFADFKEVNTARVDELLDRVETLEAKRSGPSRPSVGHGGIAGLDQPEAWRDAKTGEIIPTFSHKDRYSDLVPNKTGISFPRWMRGVLTGKHASDGKELREELKALATSPDASGGYTVPEPLMAEFIDLLRAHLVLSKAGARFVPMSSKTLSMAKLLTDATVGWHAENGNVTASDPTLGLVEMSAKTVVGLVKFSLELSQDSVNIEEVIGRSLASGTAGAIDQAGLGNTVTNGPSGIMSFGGRNRIQSIGALTSYDPWIDGIGALLRANVPLERIGASVMGPGVWTSLAKLKTGISGDKSPLPKPAALANTPFLVTNGVADNTGSPTSEIAYLGDWNDLLYGIRKDVTLHILRETFLGSNLQIAALVYARVDFAAAREQSFVTLEDFA